MLDVNRERSSGVAQPFVLGSARGVLAEGYNLESFQRQLSILHTLFSEKSSTLIKDFGHTRTAVVFMDLGKGIERFVLKQYRPRNFVNALFCTLRKSMVVRAWSMARKMQAAGISIAAPIATVEEKRRYLPWRSYLISLFVPNAVNLKEYVSKEGTTSLHDGELIRNLGHAIGNLHARGFTHGDLKWSNILVQDMNAARIPVFVDLDHVAYREGSADIRRARDLARFIVDVRELKLQPDLEEAFLGSYLDTLLINGQRRDYFIGRMERASERIAARHEKGKKSSETGRNCEAN
jgi:tRNA A-37 threonylcarbamoyl transferase component Bud32